MNWNTLIRYGLTGLTEGARILRYVLITALLFTIFPIGASFGHLPIGDRVVVWQVLLMLVVVTGIVTGFLRRFNTGWFVNMVGLVLVALTGLNPTFRLLGPCVGALYVLASMLLIGGAASTGTIFGYGVAPGEATITNAPSGEVFGIVMLVAFYMVLTVLGVGVAAPFTEPSYIAGILGLALVVIPGTLYLGIGKTTTRYVLGIVAILLIVMVAAAVLDSLHTLGVLPQSPAKALWKGATTDQCTVDRDAAKQDTTKTLADNEAWRVKNAGWLAAGSPLAKEYLTKYESGQAWLKRELAAADEKYGLCKNAKSGVPSVSFLGWFKAVIYEWPWWLTILILPIGIELLAGLIFSTPPDKAIDRDLKLWAIWAAIVIFLRVI